MCSPPHGLRRTGLTRGLLYRGQSDARYTFHHDDLQLPLSRSAAARGRGPSRILAYATRSAARWATVRSNFRALTSPPNVGRRHRPADGAIRQGGERRPTTVLFSDIRGFTAIAGGHGAGRDRPAPERVLTEMVE